MGTPNQQIGWSQEAKLMQQISKQLDRLILVTANCTCPTTTSTTSTTTTALPLCGCYYVWNNGANGANLTWIDCGDNSNDIVLDHGTYGQICAKTVPASTSPDVIVMGGTFDCSTAACEDNTECFCYTIDNSSGDKNQQVNYNDCVTGSITTVSVPAGGSASICARFGSVVWDASNLIMTGGTTPCTLNCGS